MSSPFRIAIIGTGPSGLYAAESLVKSGLLIEIDIFERLLTPYGLLRGGVAPDHLKLKALVGYFEKILMAPNVHFFGGVQVGGAVSVAAIQDRYDAVIFATGAEKDRELGIEGEFLPGCYPATAFVGWYNGHPDYASQQFDLSHPEAVVIGHGNVAIDIARILLKSPAALRQTDISETALSALVTSQVTDVYLVGRRGPAQVSFTELEMREIAELPDCDVLIDANDLALSLDEQLALGAASGPVRVLAILREVAVRPLRNASKRLHIQFLRSPFRVEGKTAVAGIEWSLNRLEVQNGTQKAVSTGHHSSQKCGLILKSVGNISSPIAGLPFDRARHQMPHLDGRVTHEEGGGAE